jgi:hypothetical protein
MEPLGRSVPLRGPAPPRFGDAEGLETVLESFFSSACCAGNVDAARELQAGVGFRPEVLKREAVKLWRRRDCPETIRWLLGQIARAEPGSLAVAPPAEPAPSDTGGWAEYAEWTERASLVVWWLEKPTEPLPLR